MNLRLYKNYSMKAGELIVMELIRGDTKTFTFRRVSRDTKEPILTKATKVYFTVKRNATDKQPLFQKTIDDMTFDEDGYYHFTILPEDTNDLSFGQYVYDIEVIVGDNGEYKQTISPRSPKNVFEILEEVTYACNEV